ncbi:hypothetical protein GALMADRAFT_1244131 [Galerina marginata CBS 339.88]|uniref:Uncharacterized protein n=1 Tax=Galerina marginata (strain CBS 339.88) TaxID=685588 RepID=A0A067TI08_GALM3|nr:hypothetical protein GALMADRAFT_1244131 [Galerina marginata CBS 339.88]
MAIAPTSSSKSSSGIGAFSLSHSAQHKTVLDVESFQQMIAKDTAQSLRSTDLVEESRLDPFPKIRPAFNSVVVPESNRTASSTKSNLKEKKIPKLGVSDLGVEAKPTLNHDSAPPIVLFPSPSASVNGQKHQIANRMVKLFGLSMGVPTFDLLPSEEDLKRCGFPLAQEQLKSDQWKAFIKDVCDAFYSSQTTSTSQFSESVLPILERWNAHLCTNGFKGTIIPSNKNDDDDMVRGKKPSISTSSSPTASRPSRTSLLASSWIGDLFEVSKV